MSKFATITAAIRDAFYQNWANATPITGDEQTIVLGSVKEFVRLSIRPANTTQPTMGDNTARTVGVVFVQVFVEPNLPTTMTRASELVDLVAACLSRDCLTGDDWIVQFRDAAPNYIGISSEGFYQVNIQVPYYSDAPA